MDNNVYNTPQSSLVTQQSGELVLGSRWSRLFASIIDGLLVGLVTLPLMYFTGGFDGISTGVEPGVLYTLGIGVAGLIVFVILNGKILLSSGQTIGKKALNIKIVDLEGNLPSANTLLSRYGFYYGTQLIPVVGGFLALINVLFIFGAEKRCLHDQVAKTKVVNAS
jgi:uncharacterized RDD family membrane protein YckC